MRSNGSVLELTMTGSIPEGLTVCAALHPADEVLSVELDESFWYNGTDNLIIEFDWPSGDESIYVWGWVNDVNRSLTGAYGESAGALSFESLLMRLNGTLSLEPVTFGAIKATPGL